MSIINSLRALAAVYACLSAIMNRASVRWVMPTKALACSGQMSELL